MLSCAFFDLQEITRPHLLLWKNNSQRVIEGVKMLSGDSEEATFAILENNSQRVIEGQK